MKKDIRYQKPAPAANATRTGPTGTPRTWRRSMPGKGRDSQYRRADPDHFLCGLESRGDGSAGCGKHRVHFRFRKRQETLHNNWIKLRTT